MIIKTILLRHIESNQELTAIHTYEWKLSTTVDGFVTKTLQDRGWSYKESYMPIRKALAAVFEQVKESNVGYSIDNEFMILNVEFAQQEETPLN